MSDPTLPACEPNPTSTLLEEPGVLVAKKHHLLVRWSHWLNVPILLGLILSGISIYWASPVYQYKSDPNTGSVDVVAALTERAPIFDENNGLVLLCRVCGTGFLQRQVGPARDSLQMIVALHQNRIPIHEFCVDVLQCDICTNTLHFAPGQPYEMLSRGRKSRVDSRPRRPSVLRW